MQSTKRIRSLNVGLEIEHPCTQRINFPVATVTVEKQCKDTDSQIVLKLDLLIGYNMLERKFTTVDDIVYQTCLDTFGAKLYQAKGPPRRNQMAKWK
ncbi:reverse transcriptase [Elysia marginata]|uniref:Reverse transcriptase n=1 Tax=Elysia marginata TaxID=1093978 RepID=A0AAV4INA1_9GAST|nr:reverse transcriptase [Elysia marginata]